MWLCGCAATPKDTKRTLKDTKGQYVERPSFHTTGPCFDTEGHNSDIKNPIFTPRTLIWRTLKDTKHKKRHRIIWKKLPWLATQGMPLQPRYHMQTNLCFIGRDAHARVDIRFARTFLKNRILLNSEFVRHACILVVGKIVGPPRNVSGQLRVSVVDLGRR